VRIALMVNDTLSSFRSLEPIFRHSRNGAYFLFWGSESLDYVLTRASSLRWAWTLSSDIISPTSMNRKSYIFSSNQVLPTMLNSMNFLSSFSQALASLVALNALTVTHTHTHTHTHRERERDREKETQREFIFKIYHRTIHIQTTHTKSRMVGNIQL
jgi:hypothetical protein